MSVTSSDCHILNIPDEILGEILFHVSARERVMLSHLSERFNWLVFRDKKLLRDLDFSKEGRLISASDIQRYFNDENIRTQILKVNLRNVNCIESGRMLNDCIGKALNLVDINIHGIEFEDLWQLGSILSPLEHVKKLSCDWPMTGVDDVERYPEIHQILHKPFSRLTYLSVRIHNFPYSCEFMDMIDSCQELKELRIDQASHGGGYVNFDRIPLLGKLEIFEFCGDFASSFKDELLDLLPESENWTGFAVCFPLEAKGFHLEDNVKACEELSDCIEDLPDSWEWTLGNTLRSGCLLKAVIRINQIKVPERFCLEQFDEDVKCVLKVEESKLLLKNPKHQIRYLYLNDSIGIECKSHVYALAGPTLTELYLSDMMQIKMSTPTQTDSQEQNDLSSRNLADSSFEMLVKNTPFVRELTLNGRPGELEDDNTWDLGALCLIPGWKNLESLRLLSIPIRDGEFLIEIGKQCQYLEKLEFYNLGPVDTCCYRKDLSLMLTHCRNLTDFSMHASNIGFVSKVFLSLTKNPDLRRVRLRTTGELNNTVDLVLSVEKLLRRCSILTTFVCIIDGISQAVSDQLTSLLRRLRNELNRPSLQFQVVCSGSSEVTSKIDTIRENTSPLPFPFTSDEFSYL